MPRHRRSVVPAATVIALGALTLAAAPAHAAEIDVPCDPGALVKAVATANDSPDPDILSLAPNCVYTLTAVADTTWVAGLPSIEGQLTVNGNHATIDRAQSAPQFRIIVNWGDLTLNEVTITGGHAPDGVGTNSSGDGNSGGSGGGIQNWGPLTINNSVVTSNTAGAGAPGASTTTRAGRGGLGGFGGGIYSYGFPQATLTINNSLVTNNISGAGGRGGDGTGSQSGGSGGSGGFGGGVSTSGGTVVRITGSTISGNATADGATGGSGGLLGGEGGSGGSGAGVFISSGRGNPPLYPTITESTITDNRAGRGGDSGTGTYTGWAGFGGSGGGLSVFYDTLTLAGGTISNNIAGGPGAGTSPSPANGGGIYSLDGHVTLTDGAVVSGNKPDNCDPVDDVPGCVNDVPTARTQRTTEAADLATANRVAAAAMSRR